MGCKTVAVEFVIVTEAPAPPPPPPTNCADSNGPMGYCARIGPGRAAAAAAVYSQEDASKASREGQVPDRPRAWEEPCIIT